jgi:hypothetical protein
MGGGFLPLRDVGARLGAVLVVSQLSQNGKILQKNSTKAQKQLTGGLKSTKIQVF